MEKIISINDAVSKVKSGMTLMIGGFISNGSPNNIINALSKTGVKDLTIICNDTAFPDKGLGILITNKQVKKVITSHIGTNKNTIEQLNNNEIEVEFAPQGSLAERVRAGGAGLGGVLTKTGLGTKAQEGKELLEVDGETFILEKPLRADIALIGANIADKSGNLVYIGTTQNFNPLMAMAADLVIAEVQELVDIGKISPERVHTPSVFVDFMVNP